MVRVFSYRAVRVAAMWAAAIAAGSCAVPTEPTTGGVGSVAVSPSIMTLVVGQQQVVQAIVTDGAGKPMTGARVVWSARDPGIATITASGVVTAIAIGQTAVAANVNGKSGVASISVQQPLVASVSITPSHVDAL